MVSPPPSPSPPPAAADQMRAAPAGGRRRKVALAPGHSHLDWMRLTATLPRYRGPTMHTAAEVAAHRRRGDAWTVIRGRVYDVSRYVDFHPGGAAMLLSGAGKVRLVSGWTVSRGGSCRVDWGPPAAVRRRGRRRRRRGYGGRWGGIGEGATWHAATRGSRTVRCSGCWRGPWSSYRCWGC